VLYAGLMLTESGPQVLEFNVRFGDPEAQVVLPLIRGDFFDLCLTTAEGRLGAYLQHFPDESGTQPADWPGAGLTDWDRHTVIVVAASDGYPGKYLKGQRIELPARDDEGAWVIHAGTANSPEGLVTSGGRVLGAVGAAGSVEAARATAYDLLNETHFSSLIFRRDIAQKRG
jgi:phosphoribosylamine--glycine ligase